MAKQHTDRLQAVVDRFENGFAVVDFGRAGLLTIPKKYLPDNIKEGSVLIFDIMTDEMARLRNQDLAKAVLSEIISAK